MNESTHDLTVEVSSLDRTSSDAGKPMTSQSGFSRDKLYVGAALVIVILLGVFAVYQFTKSNPSTAIYNNTQPINSVNQPVVSSGPTVSFTIEGIPFSYKPNEIRVKKGDNVKIDFVNKEGFHNLKIDGYNVETAQINSGETASLSFAADKSGTFAFFCSVDSHREKGMEGKLIVE